MSEFQNNISMVRKFLNGDDSGYQMDDFLSCTPGDQQSQALQKYINFIFDNYKSTTGAFASDEGLRLIKNYINNIDLQ